jgi:hypothetical protein
VEAPITDWLREAYEWSAAPKVAAKTPRAAKTKRRRPV